MDPLDLAIDRFNAALDHMETVVVSLQEDIAARFAEFESDAYQELALAEVKAT